MSDDRGALSFDRTIAIWAKMWDHLKDAEKTMPRKAFEEKRDNMGFSVMFNTRNTTDPSFHRFLNRETDYLGPGAKANVVRQHLNVLTKFVLLDNLRLDDNEYAKIIDLEASRKRQNEQPNSDMKYDGGIPSYKHLKRFIDFYYPEMITIPIKLSRRLPEDARAQLFETPFTKEETEEQFFKFREAMGYFEVFPVEDSFAVDRAGELAIRLRIFDPDDLVKLLVYRKDILRAAKLDFPPDLRLDGPSAWMVKQFEAYGYGVQALFQQLRWYVEFKWFERKPLRFKLSMLKEETQFEFTSKDAQLGIKRAAEWFNDNEFVFRTIVPISDAFAMMRKPEVSEYLYRECQRQLALVEPEATLCIENLAHIARCQGRTDEAISGLETALRRWHEHNASFDESLQRAYLIELYLKEGKQIEADVHMRMLLDLTLAMKAKYSSEMRAQNLLTLSDIADGYEHYELENVWLKEGSAVSETDDNLIEYNLYFVQCLMDIATYGKRLPDVGSNRIRHPPTGQWTNQRISNNFYEYLT